MIAEIMETVLKKVLNLADYNALLKERDSSRENGKLVGVGFSTYIEACGIAPSAVVGSLGARAGLYESSNIRVEPTGKVTVFTGSHSHGQGHETTFAQLVADELGLPSKMLKLFMVIRQNTIWYGDLWLKKSCSWR